MIAVHPTNCRIFNTANNKAPVDPKLIFTVSIALFLVFPPINPAKMSFGSTGALLFAVLNILQLVGWTAIMIYDGSLAAAGIFNIANWVWPVIIGGLIIIWILVGIENLGKINTVAMAALFILTLMVSGTYLTVPDGC